MLHIPVRCALFKMRDVRGFGWAQIRTCGCVHPLGIQDLGDATLADVRKPIADGGAAPSGLTARQNVQQTALAKCGAAIRAEIEPHAQPDIGF